MLLKNYTKEISRPVCNPSFQSVHCIAHLAEDIKEVLPYLNTALGGFSYTKEPPSVAFKVHGKLISVYPRKIAINALKDEAEADKILEWLKGEINAAWEKRAEIEPKYEATPKPKVMEILRLLPKTNSRECGRPTCMVFAAQVAEGAKGAEDCPPLDEKDKQKLKEYLGQFPL
ncbi:MAG: Fe-S cluster protein [Candidatus Aminicenantes bacterium]|nr:Fe-S cluster protein [Candidatus Aminicenantes bacterium]